MKHALKMCQWDEQDIMELIKLAKQMEEGSYENRRKQPYVVANLFYEPSTRTKSSFEMAQVKLGYKRIPFDVAHSSVQKGESLYDTVKTFEAIGVDALVIRHEQENYYKEWIDQVTIPIINGGDGCGQHPTQSLLDLYTIYESFGSFKGLKVGIAGDLRHSRVARSNVEILHRLGATIILASPEEWKDESLMQYGEYCSMDELCEVVDVLMLLRVQRERHVEQMHSNQANYLEVFGLTERRMSFLKRESIIMHPAPINRGVEIADQLVEHPKSRIFTQMKNGVFVRMALHEKIRLGGWK
ncbi:aspartate carbamoyltransferase catalytic subunit [Mangrovibacillus cuniculi]|uniref:Aspartate carbamoyltransferase n=1 Tax=Mangrovibacillus cuniculi TaxID=2593652 RepID=A0A7S8HEW1_9BACI|nr:aspartate carbamoyltransferase catalytic subunit [Mangrovibacillus cuniculi]QPC46279.1 aspartate carbamoyltransferase catalytic subunit [Mangrovibacillus cuniculi]